MNLLRSLVAVFILLCFETFMLSKICWKIIIISIKICCISNKTCCNTVAVFQEHMIYLERDNVGLGLTEDSIKRFNVGEAVYDRGLLKVLVGTFNIWKDTISFHTFI